MSLIIKNNEIIIQQSSESIKKNELEKYKENFEKIDDLNPLIFPSIKYHDHPLLEKIFKTRKIVTKFDATPRLLNPRLCITEFGTTPRYEAGKCYTCRAIVNSAEQNYDAERTAKMSKSMDIHLTISKKRKSDITMSSVDISEPSITKKQRDSSKKLESDSETDYQNVVKSSTDKMGVRPVISKKKKPEPDIGMPVIEDSSKKQVLDIEPDYGDETYLEQLVYTGNPADFEF